MRSIRKCFTLFTVIATIIWSAGLPFGLLVPKIAKADDPLSRPHAMGVRFINEGTLWVWFNKAMATTGYSATNTAFYTLTTATSSYGVASSTHQISIDADPAVSVLNSGVGFRITALNGLINPATDRVTIAADTDGTCNAAPADTAGNCNDNSSPTPFNFPPSANVSISEVRYAAASGANAATDEFIELYNASGSLVSLNNWRLRYISATGTKYTLVDNLGAGGNATSSIAAHGFYLVAGPNFVPTGTGGSATSTDIGGTGIDAGGTIILEQKGGELYGPATDYAVKDMVGCSGSGSIPIIYEGGYASCPAAGQSLERKAQSSSTATTMSTTDATNGNGYDSNTNYYDFVTRTDPAPQNHASAIETITGVTNSPPFVDHTPVTSAFNNLSATLFARMGDQETSPDSLTAQLKYSTSTSPNYWLAVTGSHIANNLFKFDVPTSTFRYYMKVTDASSASKCVASGYNQGTDCTSETTYQTNAWSVTGRATDTGQISGTVRVNSTAVSGATVIAYGAGLSVSTVTAANGTFSFTTLPTTGSYKIVAVAAGYAESIFDGISPGATNLAMDMYTSGGMPMYQGGDMTEFRAMFSMPGDNMQGAPTNINVGTPVPGQMFSPIMIGLSKEATTSTVTTSSVLLKKLVTGNWENVSGYTVAYQPRGGTISGGYSWGPEPKIVVYSAIALSDNSQYMVEILPSVRDTSGNPLQGNRMGGGHSIMFSTSMGFVSGQITTSNFGQSAAYMPPMVTGSTPSPGTRSVARNARLTVSFSEAMNSGSLTGYVQLYALDANKNVTGSALSTTNSLDTATNKILTIAAPAGNLTASTWYRLKILGGLRSANGVPMSMPGNETNTMYQADFETSAATDSTAPTVLGTSLGMYKIAANPNCSVASAGCITGVPAGLGGIDITFSKDMSPSTITTTNIVLLKGTSNVTATVSYDPMSRSARLVPSRVLDLTTDYTLVVYGTSTSATTVGDIYFDTYSTTPTHALQSDYTAIFTTTATADSGAPRVDYANADDYTLAISFSEPMNATALGSNTSATTTSVLNPANYALYTDAGPPPAAQTIYSKCGAGNDAACTTLNNETGLTFSYDGSTNTVTIKGLALSTSGGFRVYLSNVTDLSGNTISGSGGTTVGGGNMAGGGVQNSATTFGMMGPGSMGMTGAPTTVGGAMMSTGFGGNSAADMGMKPISVMPMNMMAGANSTYMIDLPIGVALDATSGTATSSIVFTFPSGFDVSGAKSADPNNIYAHKDINGPGTGTVKLLSSTTGGQHNDDVTGAATVGGTVNDGITVNTGARTVTVYLGNVALAAHDFIHLEIDGIKSASMAKDASTSGYTVTIKTKIGSTIKESLSSMPFFLQSAGKYVITGTVTLPYPATITELPIYIGSPMTGPMKVVVSFSNTTTATYSTTSSIPGLPSGNFNVFTDPLVTPTSTDFMSDSGDSRPIFLNDGAATKSQGGAGGACESSDTLCYLQKNIIFSASASKPRVTVKIKGNFSGANAGKVDIFAGGSGGYSFKTLTMDENYSTNATSTTFTLPGTGSYMLGMGPAMPRGPMMMSGPMVMPSWIPPKSVDITAGGAVGAWTWLDPDTDGSLTDDASANNGIVVLSVSAASGTIAGHVYGKSSDAIANAEVFANSPQGGFGTRATSKNDGSFSLSVGDGLYMVGAFMPGMPQGQMKSVEVRNSATTPSYYVDGVLQSGTLNVVLTMSKESYTISGKVTDASSNVVKDASVFAYRTDGPGHSEALTDSSGKYILYTGNGTWRVGAFIPGYGRLAETTVIVSSASQSNINLSPDTTTYTWRTIEGIVFIDDNETGSNVYKPADTEIAGAFVRAVNNRTGYVNDTVSMASGTYKLSVPDQAGSTDTYTIYANVPGKGELTPLAAANVDDGNLGASALTNPKVEPTSSVTINVVDADGNAYTLSDSLIDVYATGTKYDNDAKIDNATSTTMNLPGAATADTAYKLDVEIPGIPFSDLTITGADYNSTYKSIVVNGTETITITLPTLYTVTSTIQDALGTAVPNAMVSVYNPTTGVSFESQANASGTLVMHLPATSTPYIVKPEKAGYVGSVSEVTVSANTTVTLTDTAASYTVGGTVYIGSTGAANASVYGKKLGGGYTETTADANGVYSLPVTAGSWRIYAIADGYQEKVYSATVPTVISANVTGKDFTLSTAKSGLATTTATPVTPSNGGTLYDASSGLNLMMPPSALGVDTSSYQMQNKETSNAPSLPGASPLGGEAKEISAFNNSGQPISTLNDDMTLELTYTAAELSSSGVDTLAEFNQLKSMYFDSTAGGWARIPTTIMALDSDGLPVEPNATLSNVITAVIKGISDHLTVFGVTGLGDDLIPKAPTGASASAGTQQVALSWTAVTKNTTESNIADLAGYEVYRSTTSGGTYTQINASDVTGTTYTDSNLTAGTIYYYKITAGDTNGNESDYSSAVSATPTAPSTGGGGGVTYTPPSNPAVSLSSGATKTSSRNITLNTSAVNATLMIVSESATFAGMSFEAYASTKNFTLSAGNGVKTIYVKFRSASGGETTTSYNIELEGQTTAAVTPSAVTPTKPAPSAIEPTVAADVFKKVWRQAAKTAQDQQALQVIQYGLKPGYTKVVAWENAGVAVFKKFYKRAPVSVADWNIVYATAYFSGSAKLPKGAIPAEPATSATPAESQVTPAIPAAPATPAVPASAQESFNKAWGRSPKTAQDQQALQVLAYDLKPGYTQIKSWEAAAIKVFVKKYKRLPSGADWRIIHAVAYFSGVSVWPAGSTPAEPAGE